MTWSERKFSPVRRAATTNTWLALNAKWKAEGRPEIVIKPIDENLEDEDLMEMVNAGLLPRTIVDQYKADIWSKVFTDLKVDTDIAVATEGDGRVADHRSRTFRISARCVLETAGRTQESNHDPVERTGDPVPAFVGAQADRNQRRRRWCSGSGAGSGYRRSGQVVRHDEEAIDFPHNRAALLPVAAAALVPFAAVASMRVPFEDVFGLLKKLVLR